MTSTVGTDPTTGAEEDLARSAVWALLSQTLTYPTPASVAQLVEEDLPFTEVMAVLLPSAIRSAVGDIRAAFEGLGVDELEAEHRRVFSHVHSADCPPFETDYTSRDVWRQSEQLADLSGFYRAFGVEACMERPDHVSVELEFLHVLRYKAAWAARHDQAEHVGTCHAAAETFLRDHVARWLPSFADRLEALGGEGPYGAVARLLSTALRTEAERLKVEIGEPVIPVSPSGDERVMGERGLCEGS